jgi:hypothetical protein
MIHEDEEIYITRRGEVRSNQMEDKKKVKTPKAPRAKNANVKGPSNARFTAKAVTTSKASRGFTTKKPPKAYLSYPL